MGSVMNSLQRLGKALMGAVAVMPVAAIMMGIGYWIDPEGWGAENVLAAIFIQSGSAVLDNLGWIFAIAIGYGLAKDSNGASALSAFVGFATVTALIGPKAVASYKGIEDPEELTGDASLEWASQGWDAVGGKNVLFGILIGVLAAWVYNKFHAVKLPDFLAFFSGRRLVPILTSLFSIVLSGILYVLWPLIYTVLFNFGTAIQGMGPLGAGLYGFINRLLIPTGLHHAVNSIFWFDVIGIDDIGKFLGGGETIAAAKAATDAASCPGNWVNGTCEVIGVIGQYQGGFFPVMMFGLPGGALAIYLRAKPERRKAVGSLMLAGALAAFFTGVTEPLEFSFMFLAPALFLVHAVLTGLSLAIATAFHWTAGFGFSAGFIDMLLSAQNPLSNKWWMLLVLGVIYFALYFGIFYFLIGAMNLKTPGREDDEDIAAAVEEGDLETATAASRIIDGLGGADNIDTLDYCATRLRVSVKDGELIDEPRIKQADVVGLMRPGAKNIQVVIGPQVQFMYDEVARQLSNSAAEVALSGEQDT